MKKECNSVTPNPWENIKIHTPARIALGHAGGSIPTKELLQFQADHASARDAVHSAADFPRIQEELKQELHMECMLVHSAANHRHTYLQRPDLGRKLSIESRKELHNLRLAHSNKKSPTLLFIIGDGLSATAINHHAVDLLKEIYANTAIKQQTNSIILAKEARVALGDEIGEITGSTIVVMLIGERPGLSNAESIGAYITYVPKVGRTDAERNCISNICPRGLPLKEAAMQIIQVVSAALKHNITGVELGSKLSSRKLV